MEAGRSRPVLCRMSSSASYSWIWVMEGEAQGVFASFIAIKCSCWPYAHTDAAPNNCRALVARVCIPVGTGLHRYNLSLLLIIQYRGTELTLDVYITLPY